MNAACSEQGRLVDQVDRVFSGTRSRLVNHRDEVHLNKIYLCRINPGSGHGKELQIRSVRKAISESTPDANTRRMVCVVLDAPAQVVGPNSCFLMPGGACTRDMPKVCNKKNP